MKQASAVLKYHMTQLGLCAQLVQVEYKQLLLARKLEQANKATKTLEQSDDNQHT